MLKQCPGSSFYWQIWINKYGYFVLHKHIASFQNSLTCIHVEHFLWCINALLGFKISATIHCHYKAWRARIFFNITLDCFQTIFFWMRNMSPIFSLYQSILAIKSWCIKYDTQQKNTYSSVFFYLIFFNKLISFNKLLHLIDYFFIFQALYD